MTPPKDNTQDQDHQKKRTQERSGADPESDSQAAGPSGRTTPRSGTTNAPTTSSAAPSNETPGQPPDRQTSTTTLTRVTPRSPDNRSIASAPLLDPGPARDVASVAGSSVYSTELAAYSGLPRNSDPSGFPSRQTGASRYISTVQNTRTSSFSHRSISQLEYVQRRQEDLSRGRIQLDEGRNRSPSLYTLDRELRNYIKDRESTSYQHYPGTERAVFDYVSMERTDMYSTNLIESTAHLIKGSVGAGVLTMHEAYMIGGMWTSVAATIFFGLLIAYTMYMLIRSAQKMYGRLRISKLSYPDLAEAAAATAPWAGVRKYSKLFRYVVDCTIFLEMCGTCCIYQLIIAFTLKQMTEGFLNSFDTAISSELLADLRFYIMMSAPLLIPLCLIRSIKFLAPFSMLADIFVAICVMTTLYYSLISYTDDITDRPAWKDLLGFVKMCAISFYSTSGICVALPVENHMRRPRQFTHALKYATVIVILLTVFTGVFGYWAWGEECKSPITVHMPLDTFTTTLQSLLVLMLSTTFAVQFWVPFRIVWHYIMKNYKRKQAIWERFYRLVMAIVVTFISMVFPYLIPVVVFCGQFCLGFIGLVFPAFIELLVDWEEQLYSKKAKDIFVKKTKNIGLVLLGLTLSLSSVYFAST
ncbi:proton-coupled amino acid transporter-like protein pathetic [Spodoptera frugiperda]|uniref:Proton-coupled amino acid transporter-like protein pathetic n=1 Tax=Spodoptera frugiperda TaxID=7108 RepID=A0A9R0DFJ6_SPOFR|nr:proton-coupled amino acid transporter-like protein pathetic [Spodoptera frugiperda]